jgi:glucose-6-phosphate isomerase
MILDYSRQQVTGETMELLFDLADAIGFTQRREAFRSGDRINTTEDKAVLHHLLRMPKGYIFSGSVHSLADKILEDVQSVRDHIKEFSDKVRSGKHRGATGRLIKDTVVVTCGSMHLGTEFVHEALAADEQAASAAQGRRLHFVSSVDPVDAFLTTRGLVPEETLVVVISKEFNSGESLNARMIRHWLVSSLASEGISEQLVIEAHLFAVTSMGSNYASVGIPKHNIFKIWEWVIGRFSVTSAAGLLPLSLQYSHDIMVQFLNGAHDMDEHFFNAPLRDNIPVLLGLLGVWNSTFMG